MRFSVVIPAHNGEQYLRESILSALRQSRRADEIIVVDDASTDGTAAILTEYRECIKCCYNAEATGFADAWNRSVALASGDFVTILHQDDILYPEYLKHIENALKSFPSVKHFYAACDYIDEHGKVVRRPPGPHSLEPILYSGNEYARNYLNGVTTNRHIHRCPGVTTQRQLLLNECTYRKEAGHIADDDFFLRVGAFTKVVGISQAMASYRLHSASATSRVDSLAFKLAQDYVFQARYHKEDRTLLESEDIIKINLQAVKFINLLLFQALRQHRKVWVEKALSLRSELDEIVPLFMEQNLPFWAAKMWSIASPIGRNSLATLYVKFLDGMIRARDLIMSRRQK